MTKNIFVGFDTSNYTTSMALCDDLGQIIANIKYPLKVKDGERGLRQNEAVFLHTKYMPDLAGEIRNALSEISDGYKISSMACSAFPRDCVGSYMPCFLVGLSIAETAAALSDVPLYRVSHQAGHVMAASASACGFNDVRIKTLIQNDFLSLHVSGGTTEILMVRPSRDAMFDINKIGGSIDVSAGQLIDRIGVRLGYSFPCGPEVDKAALRYNGKILHRKLSVKNLECNLSGLENMANNMIKSNKDETEICAFVLSFIGRTIENMINNAFRMFGKMPVVFAGGVMCSAYIRNMLSHLGMFCEREYSSDNAAGVSLIARNIYNKTFVLNER